MISIKRIIKFIINKYKWHGKCQFDITSNIDLNSKFEGMSKIYSNCYFKGTLGYGSYIGSYSSLSAEIGKFTSIGPHVICNFGKHTYTYPYATTSPCFYSLSCQNGNTFAKEQLIDECSFYDKKNKIAIKIGSDCWIGERVFIVGGITIGDGAVILANAVVTKDVPPYSIVGGIPGKVLKYRYDADTIKFLEKIQWWNNTSKWFKNNWKLLSNIEELKRYYNY